MHETDEEGRVDTPTFGPSSPGVAPQPTNRVAPRPDFSVNSLPTVPPSVPPADSPFTTASPVSWSLNYTSPALLAFNDVGASISLPHGVILKTPSTQPSNTRQKPLSVSLDSPLSPLHPLKGISPKPCHSSSSKAFATLLSNPLTSSTAASSSEVGTSGKSDGTVTEASLAKASNLGTPDFQASNEEGHSLTSEGVKQPVEVGENRARGTPTTTTTSESPSSVPDQQHSPPVASPSPPSTNSTNPSTSPEMATLQLPANGSAQADEQSSFASCSSAETKTKRWSASVPSDFGECNPRAFSFLKHAPSQPSFPFYSDDALQIIRAVKPQGLGDDGLRTRFTNVRATKEEAALLEQMTLFMQSLKDFNLREALSYVSGAIEDFVRTVMSWEDPCPDLTGTSLLGTIFAPSKDDSLSNIPLRFLCFNAMSIEDSVGHMLAVRSWLFRRGYKALSRYEMAPFLQTAGIYIAGHDRLCRPILICRLDRLVRLAADLSPMADHKKVETLVLYGAYWFLFFIKHLMVASCVEDMVMFVDLGDVQDESPELDNVVGPALQHILYLFPLYVASVWIVDSSKRRTPGEAVQLFLTALDPGNDRMHLRQIRFKCLANESNFDWLNHEIEPGQRQRIYKGLHLPPRLCDLPISYLDGPSAGSSKHGEYAVGNVSVIGELRPKALTLKPPPTLSLRSSSASHLAKYLAEATNVPSETLMSANQEQQAEAYFTQMRCARDTPLCRHGLIHNFADVFRLLKINDFNVTKTEQALTMKIREANLALAFPILPASLSFSLPQMDECVYWHGRDRKNRPVLVIRLGALARSLDAECAIQLINFWLRFGMEYLFIPGLVDTWNILADMEGMSAFKIPSLMSLTSRFTSTYAERLGRLWVYNTGFLARSACELIFRSPKLEYVTADDFRARLSGYISSSQVEKRYGGSAKDFQSRARSRAIFPPTRNN